jgi:hypothetical protein
MAPEGARQTEEAAYTDGCSIAMTEIARAGSKISQPERKPHPSQSAGFAARSVFMSFEQIEAAKAGAKIEISYRTATTKRLLILGLACALVCPPIIIAQATETKSPPTNDVRKRSPTIVSPKGELILRQDLFDPNNQNNLRSDLPRPSGLPGSNH